MRNGADPQNEFRKGYACQIALAEGDTPWFLWSGEAASMADAKVKTMSAARTAWSIMTPLPDPTNRQKTTSRAWTGSNRSRPTEARWVVMREMRNAIGGELRPSLARDKAIAIALAIMDAHEDDPLGELATIRLPWLGAETDRHDTVARAGLGLRPPRHELEALAAIGLSAALAPLGARHPEAITIVRPKLTSATLRASHAASRLERVRRELAGLDVFLKSHRGDWIANEFVKASPSGA